MCIVISVVIFVFIVFFCALSFHYCSAVFDDDELANWQTKLNDSRHL